MSDGVLQLACYRGVLLRNEICTGERKVDIGLLYERLTLRLTNHLLVNAVNLTQSSPVHFIYTDLFTPGWSSTGALVIPRYLHGRAPVPPHRRDPYCPGSGRQSRAPEGSETQHQRDAARRAEAGGVDAAREDGER